VNNPMHVAVRFCAFCRRKALCYGDDRHCASGLSRSRRNPSTAVGKWGRRTPAQPAIEVTTDFGGEVRGGIAHPASLTMNA
jgi:hypothetical protein